MKTLLITGLVASLSYSQSLFISEYIEGSSNNKALEIYNPTGSTVNLAGYELWRIANGGDWDEGEGNAVGLSEYGSISAGDVFVICNSGIAPDFSTACDVLGTDITYYNGDDAIGLAHNGTLIDAIGEAGDDPGTGWAVAGVENATKEHTLIRKLTVNGGNINWASSAGTTTGNSEWIVFNQDTFDYLGSHGDLPEIEGCMDPAAANYDPNATTDCGDCCDYGDEVSIYDIQYSDQPGDGTFDCYPSPYGVFGEEQYVTTSGVITAIKPGSNPNFYIQDFSADTYAGIYVYDNAWNPVLGSEVTITGLVEEYYGFTEITELSEFSMGSGGNALPIKDISTGNLANGCTATGESLEGMLVKVSNIAVTQDIIDEYLEWSVSDGTGDCIIDDDMFDGDWLDPAMGQEMAFIVGVVRYAYGSFRICPRTMSDIELCATCPVADAGDNQCALQSTLITLDGSDSYDPDGNLTDFEWAQIGGEPVNLSCENCLISQFTTPNEIGDLVFSLTVYDNEGNDAADEVTISVVQPIQIFQIQNTSDPGQYNDYPSPLEGQCVVTSGIVTAVQPGSYPNFYLQNTGTAWSGIFVYNTSIDPEVGDEIKLAAFVDEDWGFTQLIDVGFYETLSSGNSVSVTPIETGGLGISSALPGEQYEGMFVRVNNVTVEDIDEYDNWTVNDGSGPTLVDDYFFVGDWPDPVAENITTIAGVVEYIYSEYKILPRNDDDFILCDVDLGNVNGDTVEGTGEAIWNILDIVLLANCVLAQNCADLPYGCAGDTNGDGGWNILDIVTLANCVLAGTCSGRIDDATDSRIIMVDNVVSIEADGFIGGVQMTLTHGADFSIEMTDRALYSNYVTEGNETRLLVITPETEDLFSYNGDFEIAEIIVANSYAEVSVELPEGNEISNDLYISTLGIIEEFSLSAAYPNPFNPITMMTLAVPTSGHVSVQVYNLSGQVVATLANEYMGSNTYNTLSWDAFDVTSGMYFVKAQAEEFTTTQKLMLIK